MKTVFVILDTGAAMRNILRTGVFERLRQQQDVRWVIFTPLADPALQQALAADHVQWEIAPRWQPNRLVAVLRSLRRDLWARTFNVFSYNHKRQRKGVGLVRNFLLPWLTRLFFHNDPHRLLAVLHRWEMAATPALAAGLFERYQPAMVFFTSLFTPHPCLELAAWQRRVPTLCFIHSWDNPTTKGPLPILPDGMVVWNRILQQELVTYHHYPADRIRVTGVPQFDLYQDHQVFMSREAFFLKHGLDAGRQLVTYTTSTTILAPFEPQLVARLHQMVTDAGFPRPVQLLVRLHPKDDMALYAHLQGLPHLVFTAPGTQAAIVDKWNPSREEMYGLAELMAYSDVVINVASTITLDAVMFDRPVINVAFDGDETLPWSRSCRAFYRYEHYRRVVDTGGVRLAHSYEELRAHLIAYLANPQLDALGRRRIREEQAGFLDGQSSARLAQEVLNFLETCDTLAKG